MTFPRVTICYVTGRLDPRFEWFADGLHRETKGDYTNIDVVVVDYWADENGIRERGPDPSERRAYFEKRARFPIRHVPPKPTVWQGRHRLTERCYFAAANARNTGLCLAKDGWIAYADDLAVILPGWLKRVRCAMREGYVALGAYRKIPNLVVRDGSIVSPTNPLERAEFSGWDSRWPIGSNDRAVSVTGDVMYGCTVAAPIETLLAINGWDERADARGLGSEDYLTGIYLTRSGADLRYDRRMMTIEEDLATPSPFIREIATRPGDVDASHRILQIVRDDPSHACPNYFPEGGVRGVRERVLAGGDFPPATIPEHCWYTGISLREL